MSKPGGVITQRWNWTVVLQSLFLYAASFVLALAITLPFLRPASDTIATNAVAAPQSAGGFLVLFGVATVIAVLLVKYLSDQRFWTVFFGVAAFSGLFLTLFYPLTFLVPDTAATVLSAASAIALLVARASSQRIWLHNLVVLLATVGVARLFGTRFTPETTVAILLMLAAYDIIAVYFSKHMIAMAVKLFERHAFFGMVIPDTLPGWQQTLSEAELKKNITIIGGGDIAFPLFFALSVLLYFGVAAFWVMGLATLVGVLLMHFLSFYPKTKRPIPGLPPLVLCSLGGYYLIVWLSSYGLFS